MKKIIITSSFNLPMGSHPEVDRLSEYWIEYRINIFMNYTYKSFVNQTNQDFTYFIKYDPLSENIIKNILSKYPQLPNNIKFISNNETYFQITKQISNYDYFYLVRIDADDMFHPTFIQQLIDYNPKDKTKVLINQDGYIYDIENHLLAVWSYLSPPFYTLIYNSEDFKNRIFYKFPGGHKDVVKLDYEVLDKKNFIVLVHGKNTETKFFSIFNKGLIEDLELKNSILNEFDIKYI
ncbi:glycosyltransferase [Romboutsia sedimentorum]|uniref:glycosyltransferase n=1 Tax=Romboutsia sedimentorum TaxID=1368474 RepID=UPI0024DE1542|nr:glycosyltransferase [Romboutsia sedimentorum]MDK2585456.1 glycosyltransferase [Romboutsia sedimentorum]